MGKLQAELPKDKIVAFCKKRNISEFSLFGSALREDFHSGSDIDVLVTLEKNQQR